MYSIFESTYQPIGVKKRRRKRPVFLQPILALILFFISLYLYFRFTVQTKLEEEIHSLNYVPGSTLIPRIKVGPHKNPRAKEVVKQMDWYISNHVAWDDIEQWHGLMDEFFVPEFNYVTIYGLGAGTFTGIKDWFYGEHIPFNFAFPDTKFSQLIFIGDDIHASTTTYAKATWKNEFVGVKPSNKVVSIRIHDFYIIDEDQNKILTNWMMIDVVDLMRQAGYQVLAKPRAEEGWFQPPRAMDGIPAPIAFPSLDDCCPKAKFESIIKDAVHHDWVLQSEDASLWSDDMIFYGPGGIGFMPTKQWYISDFLKPLHEAFTEPSIETYVLLCQRNYCAMNGVFKGVQSGTWLGEKPEEQKRELRFGMHFRLNIDSLQIEDGYLMLDLPHYFAQVGTILSERTSAEYLV